MRCFNCDYDLTGLSVNRCPECGTPFNPVGAARPSRVSVGGAILTLVMVPLLSIAAFWVFSDSSETLLSVVLCLAAATAIVSSGWLAVRLTRTVGPTPTEERVARVLYGLLLMFAFLVIQCALFAGLGIGSILVACGMGAGRI